jgi:Ca2+-binding EF-hand superfamily protein
MKKLTIMTVAAVALITAPAMANDIDKKVDWKFQEADTNNDGMISKTEHSAAATQMFNEADTDKDGALSKEEVKAHMEAKKAAKKG